METDKLILDACCGSKMMWFDKKNPYVLFADVRTENHVLCDGRVLSITPDVEVDFRDMPFADKTFKMIAFDPPHLVKLGASSWMALKYGRLNLDWEKDIKQGFDECMRCLDDYGTLIFKWNESQIKTSHIIAVIGAQPLFGHISGKRSNTIWMTFMKTPKTPFNP